MTPCGLDNPGITETLIAMAIQVSKIFVVLQYTRKTGILFAIAVSVWSRRTAFMIAIPLWNPCT